MKTIGKVTLMAALAALVALPTASFGSGKDDFEDELEVLRQFEVEGLREFELEIEGLDGPLSELAPRFFNREAARREFFFDGELGPEGLVFEPEIAPRVFFFEPLFRDFDFFDDD
ncbi:MAG: hypothetical protein HY900_23875 [Deltaproteobacteria bacterium]|nr:hypothetical protein [Deltaproteobacteria bacterium]